MNKSGLIEALSRKENLTEKMAIDVVNLVFKGFTDELRENGRIEIRGFGSFVVRKYEAYTGKKPQDRKEHQGFSQEAALLQGGQGTQGEG